MNKEEIKKIAKEEFINNVMKNIDSALIFTYISNLEVENKRLNNIINEIFEWMQNKYDNSDLTGFTVSFQELEDLKELKKIKSKGD